MTIGITDHDTRLLKMSQCFLGFTDDPDANINRLTALCGELLGGTCALYDRLDQGLLCALGQWNTPPDFNPIDRPDGHICYDVITHGDSDLIVVRNLSQTRYADTDPNVRQYSLETYIGQVVKCADESVGSLCVVYQDDFVPTAADEKLMGVLAAAVGVEEERKRAVESLRQSEERYRAVVKQSTDGIFLVDIDDGRILDSNPAFQTQLGYSADELLRLTLYQIDAYNRESVDENIEEILTNQEHYLGARRYFRKNGTLVDVEVSVHLISYGGREVMCALVRDITDRRRLENEMVRLERMRALGEMAQGIAHNFNNILAVVLGYAELARDRLNDPVCAADLDEVISSALRGEELVQRLSQAVRQEEDTDLEPVALNGMIPQILEATRPRWKDEPEARGQSVEVVTRLSETQPVSGSDSGVHDILINLLFNAVDALPDGGTITIETSQVGRNIVLTITDNGIGMDEDTRQRVFEPFFTTKMDVGTGLGLATVYGTVHRWGGDIQVESEEGKGTSVTLRLPAWSEPKPVETLTAEVRRLVRRANILVVEDDESICGMLTKMLSADHVVEYSLDGREAIDRFAAGAYDVVLIDLGMPDVSGDQVATAVKARNPEVSTVLITGWVLEESDPRLQAFDFTLEKPVRGAILRDVVAQAVELRDGIG